MHQLYENTGKRKRKWNKLYDTASRGIQVLFSSFSSSRRVLSPCLVPFESSNGLTRLKRWGSDPGLDQVVNSTCQAVRNAAVKALAHSNSTGWLLKNMDPFSVELGNLCFGNGFQMWEGKIVSTGACGFKANVNSRKTK